MAKWGENNFFCNHERLFGFAGMSSPPAKANVLKWSFNLFAIGIKNATETAAFIPPPKIGIIFARARENVFLVI